MGSDKVANHVPCISSLHKNLIEHLNAEIVLHTITSVPIALEWIKSTFLYIRIKQNPTHYGKDIPAELNKQQLEDKLQGDTNVLLCSPSYFCFLRNVSA